MLASSSDSTGIAVVLIVLYFLPTLIAVGRKATNGGSVFLINLLTGWTVIGWFVALGLSGSGSATHHERVCPACGQPPKRGATVCRRCGHDFAGAAGGTVVSAPSTPKWHWGDPFR
jgi:hypothetical protein